MGTRLEGYTPMNLDDMQIMVREVNRANGWFDSARSFGEDIALIHSEVSEALEAYREYGLEDATVLETWEGSVKNPKPEGVGSEFADILVRLLDACQRYGIDLEDEFKRKMNYNATRGYRHGGKRL